MATGRTSGGGCPVFDRLRRVVSAAIREWREFQSLSDLDRLIELGEYVDTAAGVRVTPTRAMQFSAVFACVRVLSETIASLPLHLYRRQNDRKSRAPDHPLYGILHDQPNPIMTSFEFREVMQGHVALRGNAYAEIVRGNDGEVKELWPIHPDHVRIYVDGWQVYYVIRAKDGTETVWPSRDILHLRGLSSDGIRGLSPIMTVMEAVGLGLAAEEYGARFFQNDARPSVVLKHPGKLGEEAASNLRKSWKEAHAGSARAHRVAVLEEGMSIEKIGISPEEAQFLETRKFQVSEIARIFRVPPHMIGDLEKATYSNVEQQAIDFVVHTIRPWLVKWEQAISKSLLTEQERREYFAEFMVDGLLRGDANSRWQAYATAIQWGVMSPNEVRDRENMNPRPGGDAYLTPLNFVQSTKPRPDSVEGDEETKSAVGRYEVVSAVRLNGKDRR